TTSRGVISLGCSILGGLGTIVLPAIYSYGLHQETTGVSAGLAVLCYGFLSGMLSLLGIIFGIVALRGIRLGERGGRGMAWTGIVLGALPITVFLAYAPPLLWAELSNAIRMWGSPPKS